MPAWEEALWDKIFAARALGKVFAARAPGGIAVEVEAVDNTRAWAVDRLHSPGHGRHWNRLACYLIPGGMERFLRVHLLDVCLRGVLRPSFLRMELSMGHDSPRMAVGCLGWYNLETDRD